jgi:DNA helicase HerA-like ATPase
MSEGIKIHEGNCLVGIRKSTLERQGLDTALFLGQLAEKDSLPYQVYMDSLYPHVVFICGTRGSGKSYTLGIIAEELIEKNPNVGIVIIDPIGVFWSMKSANKEKKEVDNLKKWGIIPKNYPVKVMVPKGVVKKVPRETYDKAFTLPISDLTVEDWALTFKLDRFDTSILLMERALSKLGDKFSIDDIVQLISSSSELVSKEKGFVTQTRRGLVSRLMASEKWGILSDEGTSLSEIVVPGQITVIDTSFLEEAVANLVIGFLARKILNARKIATRVGRGEIPPSWLLIDEAHTAIPSREKTAASDSIIEYVKQGRRPGCSIILATQQPAAVDSRVLSQLDILIAHKLVFKDDIDAVFKRMPTTVKKEMKKAEFIRDLPLGMALIGDKEEFIRRAVVIKLRPRKSQHEGRAIPSTETKISKIEKKEKRKEIDKVSTIVSQISVEEIEKIAEKMKKKKFLIFGHDETIEKSKVLGWPIWNIEVYYPSEKFVGYIMFDGMTGELVGAKTQGLLELAQLKPVHRKILINTQKKKVLSELEKMTGVDKKSLKRQLKQLIEKGLIISSTVEKETFYKSAKKMSLPSLKDAAAYFRVSDQPIKDLIDPEITKDDVFTMLEMWGSPRIKKADIIYHPLWIYRMKNGDERLVLIDGVTGKKSTKFDDFKNLFERLM